MAKHRRTETSSTSRGGCLRCSGRSVLWDGANAQAVAARHHDSTGHETWVEVTLVIHYGCSTAPRQGVLPI